MKTLSDFADRTVNALVCLNQYLIKYPHAKFAQIEEDFITEFADLLVEEIHKSYSFREGGQHECQ